MSGIGSMVDVGSLVWGRRLVVYGVVGEGKVVAMSGKESVVGLVEGWGA